MSAKKIYFWTFILIW